MEGVSTDPDKVQAMLGKNVIFVMVDRMKIFSHFITLSHPFTALKVAQKFLKRVHALHEFPESIVSNRDMIYLRNFWQEFFKLVGTQLKFSTAYHPRLMDKLKESIGILKLISDL